MEPTYPAEPGIYLQRADGGFVPVTLYMSRGFHETYAGTDGLQSSDFLACTSPCRFVIAHMPALDTTTLQRATPRSVRDINRPASQYLRADPEPRLRPIPVRAVAEGVFRFEIEAERRTELPGDQAHHQLLAIVAAQGAHGVRAMFLVVRQREAT